MHFALGAHCARFSILCNKQFYFSCLSDSSLEILPTIINFDWHRKCKRITSPHTQTFTEIANEVSGHESESKSRGQGASEVKYKKKRNGDEENIKCKSDRCTVP